MTKCGKIFSWKSIFLFFIPIKYIRPSCRRAFSPQKRISSTWKHEISSLFMGLYSFWSPGSGSGSSRPKSLRIRIHNTVLYWRQIILFYKINLWLGSLPDSSMGLCVTTTRCATPSRSSSLPSSTPWNLLKERWNDQNFYLLLTENGKYFMLYLDISFSYPITF